MPATLSGTMVLKFSTLAEYQKGVADLQASKDKTVTNITPNQLTLTVSVQLVNHL